VSGHPVQWVTAAPLWSSLLAAPNPSTTELDRMQQPALLRMTSDEFMEELSALLAEDPARVADLEARPKSYRAAPPGAAASYEPAIDHVKLFQPAHGQFNLVAATLVCRVAGLPDKAIDGATQQEVAFVLRRIAPGADTELFWDGATWAAATPQDSLGEREQLVPMFPVPYAAGGRRRRLLVGLVPTTSVESTTSGGAISFSPQPGDRTGDPPDRRLEELEERILDQLDALRASTAGTDVNVEISRFLALDLAEFLARHVEDLWTAVQDRQPPASGPLLDAYNLLDDTSSGTSWVEALNGYWAERDRIWGDDPTPPSYEVDLKLNGADLTANRATLEAALPARTGEMLLEPQPPFAAPKVDPRADARYVVRCVYRRPACGALHPDLVSEPSQRFAIAGFFDLDAPARPLHIALPIDTTIAGLRKAPKNVSFMISRELRQQMNRVTGLQAALDNSLDEEQPLDLGMICSFSIPIITICALIVLLIFVMLLNLVFWWLPFLRICFPLPLKARN
jgi:hypothetical protein